MTNQEYGTAGEMSKSHRLLNPALRAVLIAVALGPVAAHAFIDERTPPKPVNEPIPPIAVPAAPAPAVAPPVAAAVTPAPVAAEPLKIQSQAQAVSYQAGVQGNLTAPAWETPYPGPFGTMPLADALIAQVVPVVGGAIELNGPPELLKKQVTLASGMNRRDTLRYMAEQEKLGVIVQGSLVTLANGMTPNTIRASSSEGAALPAAEVAKVTKIWRLDAGQMLSTAMLDWATQWGWKLIWQADVDYRIAAPITIEDDFLGGAGQIIDAYKNADRPLWGDWNDQQRVLVVSEPSNKRLR